MDRSVAQGHRNDPSRHLPALAVAVVAFAVARIAMQPGLEFWDTGEYQAVAPLMGTGHPTGFPTYVLLGWLVSVILQPVGEPALRMNLFAAICLAIAAGLTVDLVRALTRSVALGFAAGLGLALTPIAWAIGTHADPHALYLVFGVILLRLLVAWEDGARDRALVGAAVVFGLAAGTHSVALLLIPAVALFVLAVRPAVLRQPRLVAACLFAVAATLTLVYLELPLRAGPFRAALVYGTPETWSGFWYVALGQQFQGDIVGLLDDLPAKARALADLAAAQFGVLAAFLPLAFLATLIRRPRYALLTGVAVLVTCTFAAAYKNADIGRYYLGPIVMAWTWLAIMAIVIAEGASILLAGRIPAIARPARPDDPRPTGMALVATLLAFALLVPSLAALGPRRSAVDRSTDTRAAAWLDEILPKLAPDAVVISGWSYSTPLWYAQTIEGRRPDIVVVDDQTRSDLALGTMGDVIEANLDRRPVYVMRQNQAIIPWLQGHYRIDTLDLKESGILIHVLDRLPPAP